MSDMLNIGASGVRAYQSALTTVSENIANAGTTGYARRTTGLQEIAAPSGAIQRQSVSGNGVMVTGTVRQADELRSADVRASATDLAKSETSITWLTGIQSAMTGSQLGDRLTDFFNSATTVASDPTASAPRTAMLGAASAVAGAFTQTGKALDAVNADLDTTAETAVSQLNGLAATLAKVNDGISRTAPGTSSAAQLLDQRDQVLDQMSAITDTSVSFDAAGRASVKLGNATGPVLVAGSDAGAVTYLRSDSGNVSFALHRSGTVTGYVPSGGALAGIVDGAARIADAKTQLTAVAKSFTDGVNAVQAQGRDLDANAGAAMFSATGTSVSLTLSDPRGIAAAAVGGGPRDNSNLTALATLRTSGAFEANTTQITANNAATLASRKQVADAQTSIHDGAVAARDAVSGVNLDTEAVDLMRFQQAYSASSRVIQVARETLQSILDIR
jgi:flagellar hook-associated protein 1 FlgK